jgi:hypothetical protein
VATSHRLTVLSWLPDAIVLPSGEYSRIVLVCPLNAANSLPAAPVP